MASIESLLNPLPEEPPASPQQALTAAAPGPAQTCTNDANNQTDTCVRTPVLKRPKIAKDAPSFKLGKPRGEIRYPPCEYRDEQLKKEHEKFELFPMGDEEKISNFPRHVPYNSEKKSFLEKTGRECFEGKFAFAVPLHAGHFECCNREKNLSLTIRPPHCSLSVYISHSWGR
jgi:hypothetical protein